MRKIYTVIFLTLLMALMIVPLQAQYNFTGAGARAAGMGNAFTGVADDATAISWNAAGLTQLYSMEATVITRFGFGSAEITGIEGDAPTLDYKSKFQLNFLSFIMPFAVGKYNIVGGISYRTLIDFNNELTMTYMGTTEDIYKSEGGVRTISPALGFQLNEMFSFGTAINIYTGSAKWGDNADDEESYTGLGIDLSALVKPSPMFSIGANLTLPHTVTSENDASGEEYEMKVPFFFSLGLGFRATDNLLIAFDYQNRDWSRSENFDDPTMYTDEQKDLYDVSSIHVGLEYLLMSGDLIIPLRAGFYTNPIAGSTEVYGDNSSDQLVNNVITLGAGLIMGQLLFDGAFEIESSETKDYAGYSGVNLEETQYRVTIGATLHFGENK
ncbi:MAG: hypothetical protein JXR46_01905 [Calditrichaceae bacterium]|nr:hypothetical protein [Calditrichaceae bacterium]MBN2707774.1 hypothetical protein [Calditrichaceae bacterium]RQV96408.1 MAG: hypothetical protein EH224_04765 [Calditrichota bacterium]